ncbi:Co-chaperone, partial [Coemansia sp. RSA 552]
LTRAIGAELEKFTDKLKEDNGKGMFIPDDEAGEAKASNPQVAKEFKDGKAGSGVGVAKAKGENAATFGTVSIKQTPEFLCSADDLFATLTDPQRVSVWTRGPAEIQPAPNTKFKLFGGHIEGEILALTPGRLIEQTWRVATWPAGHYSKVKMELEQLSNATRLTLNQTDVPLNEEDATKSNWERYYWNSIKGSFG